MLITYLSLATLGNLGNKLQIPYKDKMVHFVFYFLFTLLWYLYKNPNYFIKKTAITITLFAITYGIIMELLQATLTTTRVADSIDVFANSLGAILGILALKWYLKKT